MANLNNLISISVILSVCVPLNSFFFLRSEMWPQPKLDTSQKKRKYLFDCNNNFFLSIIDLE